MKKSVFSIILIFTLLLCACSDSSELSTNNNGDSTGAISETVSYVTEKSEPEEESITVPAGKFKPFIEYILENQIDISCLDTMPGEYIDIDNYDIFLIGEIHGTAYTGSAELELVKYFNKKHGITDLILECGISDAYILNEYLRTGDTSLLEG